MGREDVDELVGLIASVDGACRDRAALTTAVAALGRLRSWLDGRAVALARQLADAGSGPEHVLVESSRCSAREAALIVARAKVTDVVPALGPALAEGVVSGPHVDVIGRALRRLEPDQRGVLADHGPWLVEVAARTTPEDLDRAVTAEVRRWTRDDGRTSLERQRRATRLRTWLDDDGMWCLSGRFDPEAGLGVHARLRGAVARCFAEHVPDGAPSDPLERHGFLLAHAFLHLVHGGAPSAGSAEVVVVVDASQHEPSGVPAVDWGLPVELPYDVLHRFYAAATVHPVVVQGGVVVHAPGVLDLGRTTRLANRAQRRALRALYPTCAMPGCPARFELCKLHHVVWWRHGGSTDLANLLPLCTKHHHAVHDLGWQLTLSPDRLLTVGSPDGTWRTVGPPSRAPATSAGGSSARSAPAARSRP